MKNKWNFTTCLWNTPKKGQYFSVEELYHDTFLRSYYTYHLNLFCTRIMSYKRLIPIESCKPWNHHGDMEHHHLFDLPFSWSLPTDGTKPSHLRSPAPPRGPSPRRTGLRRHVSSAPSCVGLPGDHAGLAVNGLGRLVKGMGSRRLAKIPPKGREGVTGRANFWGMMHLRPFCRAFTSPASAPVWTCSDRAPEVLRVDRFEARKTEGKSMHFLSHCGIVLLSSHWGSMT